MCRGRQSIKMYDKGERVLRIEATSNDITFFRHHRKVVGRDGKEEYKMAALKKSIDSLSDVAEILGAACGRYLDFLGTLEDNPPPRVTTWTKSVAPYAMRKIAPGAGSISSCGKTSQSCRRYCTASSSSTV